MKLYSSVVRNSLFVFAVMMTLTGVRAGAQSKADAANPQEKQTKSQSGFRPFPRNDAGLEEAQEGPEFLRHRQDWFFKPRAFPLGFIPQGARERALQQKTLMYQREGRLSLFAAQPGSGFLPPPAGTASAWVSIGPQPTSASTFGPFTSGRVTAVVVNPNNANNVYIGGADGGLWVTTDGGTTWNPLTDNPVNAANIPTVAVGVIAVDPTTCGAVPSGICTTVYVGTGEDNFGGDNVYGEGILKCTVTAGTPPTASCTQDSTFHSVSPLDAARGGPMIGALAINRAAGKNNILLAGVFGNGSTLASGIWCSSDSGSTWTHVLGTGNPGTDAAFASDGTAWVALGFPFATPGNGIYKSSAPVTSCTITFTQQVLPSNFTASNIGRITLALAPAPAPSSDATIYAAIADATTGSANLLGVVRSINATAAPPTWTQLTDPLVSAATGFCTGQCFYDMALAVDPGNPAVVYGGGSGINPIIRTITGTTTASFADITGAGGTVPHVDTHAFGFAGDGSKVYVGNDGGVNSASGPAGTITWSNLNGQAGTSTGALNLTQFYPGVSIHPSNPSFALGGTQDNDVQVDLAASVPPPSAALLWQSAGLNCDGGYTVIDPAIPSTSYGECEYIPSTLLIIGVTFAGDGIIGNGLLATTGIDRTDRGSFIPPLVIDPTNTNTLYFGTCRVYKTTNNAGNWSAISPDVTSAAHAADCSAQGSPVLSTIAVAKGTSNTIYVGSDAGDVEVSANGGTTWTSIAANGGVLPGRAVTQIVVDPSSATGDLAYVVFSGFSSCAGCDAKGHVFKTVNGTAGAATVWTDISGTTTKLPDIPVNALVIDPDDATHNTLYVGTDIGAFFSTDGGINWSPLGAASSLPNSQILSLTLHNPSRTLRAATHGRGMWDLNLGPGPNTPAFEISKLSPFSANAGGSGFTLTVNGTGLTGGTVLWNGSTTGVTQGGGTATQLTATIASSLIASGSASQVTVMVGSTTSNALVFTVLGSAVPTITSSSQASPSPVNSPNPVQLTVMGTNFVSNSTVLMNPDNVKTALNTVFVSATQLTATVPASFMANFGSTNSVGVQNPPPGGGITITTPTVTLPTFVVVAPPPANDNFANAINITSTSFMDTKDSSGATTETNDPQAPACVPAPVKTIWYKVVPTGTGLANIDTIGSNYDTVLSLWSGTAQTALTEVACNDDIKPGVNIQSQLTNVTLTAGTTYYIMVSSFGPQDPNPIALGGKSVLNFTFTGAIGGGGAGSFTVSGTAATVTAGASGTSTITVTPNGGFTGMVTVSCPAAASLPPGVTCPNSPLAITVPSGGGNGTGTLNVTVAAPAAQNASASVLPAERTLYAAGMTPTRGSSKGWWILSGGTGLAAVLLVLLPGRKRYRAALGLGLMCIASLALGCGGSYGGGGSGPVVTTTKITVTSVTKAAAGATFTFAATVTGGTPTDSIQLLDNGVATGAAVAVANGTATLTTAALNVVGTHTITAHYAGDATSTQASSSGPLNVTVIGSTTIGITTSPAATPAAPALTLMIN